MRTIGTRWRGRFGDYAATCAVCGVRWMRSKMQLRDGALLCPDDRKGMTLAETGLERARLAARGPRVVPPSDGGFDRLPPDLLRSHGTNLLADYKAEDTQSTDGRVWRIADSSRFRAHLRSAEGPTDFFPDWPSGDSSPFVATGEGLRGLDCVRFGVGQTLIAEPVATVPLVPYPAGTVVHMHLLAKLTSPATVFQSFAGVWTGEGVAANLTAALAARQWYTVAEGAVDAAGAYDDDWHVWSCVATAGADVRLLRDGTQIATSGGTAARGLAAWEKVTAVTLGDPIAFYPFPDPSVPNQAAFDFQRLTVTGVETQEQLEARAAMYLADYGIEYAT